MVTPSPEHRQSLDEFRDDCLPTLDRLDRTGQAQVLTHEGRDRAVLLSPEAYDRLLREAEITQDAAAIRASHDEYRHGQARPLDDATRRVRDRLQAAQPDG